MRHRIPPLILFVAALVLVAPLACSSEAPEATDSSGETCTTWSQCVPVGRPKDDPCTRFTCERQFCAAKRVPDGEACSLTPGALGTCQQGACSVP